VCFRPRTGFEHCVTTATPPFCPIDGLLVEVKLSFNDSRLDEDCSGSLIVNFTLVLPLDTREFTKIEVGDSTCEIFPDLANAIEHVL
jgi:hypothetical protein